MIEMDDIGAMTKRAILLNEMQIIKNTRYQLEVRYKINKKVGIDDTTLKSILDELEKVQKILDAYAQEIKLVEDEIRSAHSVEPSLDA